MYQVHNSYMCTQHDLHRHLRRGEAKKWAVSGRPSLPFCSIQIDSIPCRVFIVPFVSARRNLQCHYVTCGWLRKLNYNGGNVNRPTNFSQAQHRVTYDASSLVSL